MSDRHYDAVVAEITSTKAHLRTPMERFIEETNAHTDRMSVTLDLGLLSMALGRRLAEGADWRVQFDRIGGLLETCKALPKGAITKDTADAFSDAQQRITAETSIEDVRRWLDFLDMLLTRAAARAV